MSREFSPSTSYIWANCPGMIDFVDLHRLTKVENENTIAGTRAHYLLSQSIKTNTKPKNLPLSAIYKDSKGEWQADKEMIDAVQVAYDYVMARSHEISIAPLSEEVLDCSEVVDAIDSKMIGTCDVYIKGQNYLEVIDFKYGMGEVQVVENIQLELYAAGIIKKYQGYNPANIQLTIIQPRIKVLGQEPIKSQLITMDSLIERWVFISKALRLANESNPKLIAGLWCKHCPALGHCSANTEQSLQVLGYNPLDVVDQSMKHVDVTTLPDEQLSEIYLASKQIKQTLVACEVELTKRAQIKPVKGVKLVHGPGSKSWNVSDEQVIKVLTDEGIPRNALHVEKFMSPAQALKLTYFDLKQNKNINAGKIKKELISTMITVNKGKPKLASENDSRKSIESDVHFKKIEVDNPKPFANPFS